MHVAFPALSRLQDSDAEYCRYYEAVIRILSTLALPIIGFIISTPEIIVETLLGEQWTEATPFVLALALAGIIQPTVSTVGMVSLSLGKSKQYFKVGFFHTIVVSAGFIIGLQWGALGVAWSYAVSNFLTMFPMLKYTFRGTPVSLGGFLKSHVPALLISLPATAVTMYLHPIMLRLDLLTPLKLVLCGGIYGVICCATGMLIPRVRLTVMNWLQRGVPPIDIKINK